MIHLTRLQYQVGDFTMKPLMLYDDPRISLLCCGVGGWFDDDDDDDNLLLLLIWCVLPGTPGTGKSVSPGPAGSEDLAGILLLQTKKS